MSKGPRIAIVGDNDAGTEKKSEAVSPLSMELVIGVVGYAGSGCSTAAKRMKVLLESEGYTAQIIKLSKLIADHYKHESPKVDEDGIHVGVARFTRVSALQDRGDELRAVHGHYAVAALAIKEIKKKRGPDSPGSRKLAFILDSIKHSEEVRLLRRVYDQSFRLVAVHCERDRRETRLIGNQRSTAKYAGAADHDVRKYMDRDEKDQKGQKHGQQVREAFYLADFFVDNNTASQNGKTLLMILTGLLSCFLEQDLYARLTASGRCITLTPRLCNHPVCRAK